jgi:dTDP-4-amino-4,6-dideoxygalactose transaminase
MKSSRNDQGYLVFSAPVVQEEGLNEVMSTLQSGWWGTGPKVKAFEEQFARYKGFTGSPVAVNSCTAALHLAFIAADLRAGDEVILPAMTFCATCNAIIHAGATPVPVDVDPDTYCIDPDQVRKAITPRTKAIVVVHFAGFPCDMEAIEQIAAEHKLKIIEDCAHAVETICQGRKAGMIGDFGCFSFYVTKNVSTGEGGMILARDAEALNRCRVLSLHGMSKDAWKRFSASGYNHYQVVEFGFKYNMMDLQAALGLHQLKAVEQHHGRRKAIWDHYMREFADLPMKLPADTGENSRHAYHLFPVLISEKEAPVNRDQFLNLMHGADIGCGVHYQSLLEHPVYQNYFKLDPDALPVAYEVGRTTVSLPLSARLTDLDVEEAVKAVKKSLA